MNYGPVWPPTLEAVPPPYKAYTLPAGSANRVGTSCRFGFVPLESVQPQSRTALENTVGPGWTHPPLSRPQARPATEAWFVVHATSTRFPTCTAVASWYQTGWVSWPSDPATWTGTLAPAVDPPAAISTAAPKPTSAFPNALALITLWVSTAAARG